MTSLKTTSDRKPLCIFDLLVLVAVSALPMAGALPPSDAIVLVLLMLPLGFVLWWLPGLGGRGHWPDLLILPAFMALTFIYIMLSLITFIRDPTAAVSLIGAQLIAMIYVTFRS
jgi:hypothetical protein